MTIFEQFERFPRIFVTLSYLYRNRILERHDLDKKFAKFHESSRILTFIDSWRFVGFVVCVEWGIIHEVCLAHIFTAVFPIGSDTSLPHVCEANYVRDQAD